MAPRQNLTFKAKSNFQTSKFSWTIIELSSSKRMVTRTREGMGGLDEMPSIKGSKHNEE